MKLDDAKKLHQKKYRQLSEHFLVEGEHLVLELLRALEQQPALAQGHIFVTEQYQTFQQQLPQTLLTTRQMAQLSDTKSPQGIIAVVPQLVVPADHKAVAVYLHEVQDPGNLGTIMRTLAWFGRFQLLLSPGSVDPFNAKVVRASMGAVFHLPVLQDIAPEYLLDRYHQFACLDMVGDPLQTLVKHEVDCLVFGNEARGVPPALIQRLGAKAFTIPGAGAIESLNLASALNMCVWELCR